MTTYPKEIEDIETLNALSTSCPAFSRYISHHFRNALSVAYGALHLIELGKKGDDIRDHLCNLRTTLNEMLEEMERVGL